jgi:uncharacterized membrane protein
MRRSIKWGPTWGRYLSRTTILTCILLFVAGVFVGVVTYLQRSDVAEQHVPGSNAVPAHVVLALVAVGLAILVSRLRLARKAPYPIWVAPFSRSGLDRFRRTTSLRAGPSLGHVVRALVAVVLAVLLLFNFLRAGQQVVAGLDPNFTINAWGGPSYLGAMLAHYLDAVYLFYLEALLMDVVLLKHT